MLIIIICRSSLILGHVGAKTRLLGQILRKHCVHSRGHSSDPKFMKLCQNVNSGCPRSGKKSGKKYFFKVRELSGNFEVCQEILEFK